MVKIIINHNGQDVIHTWSFGRTFPQVNGKLLRLEINGNDLIKLSEQKEVPIHNIDNSYLIWHGRNAGKVVNLLREMSESGI